MIKHNLLQQLVYGLALGLHFPSVPLHAANIASTTFTLTGVLEAKTCSFEEASLTVELPEVDTRSLVSNHGVHGTTNFTLALNCSHNVSEVRIIPSGTAVESGDNTLFQNTGTAGNVGLRLLSGRQVLTPDGQSQITVDWYDRNNNGPYIRYFTAGYAGTGAGRVNGGSFQTVVTFSLDYS